METFTTRNEATEAIAFAIEQGDANAGEFNLDAITDEVYAFDEATQTFTQVVDPDEFWEIVVNHAL